MGHPSLQNLVLVESTSKQGENRYGTGYFLTADRVLTARHVLRDLDSDPLASIRVRQEGSATWFDVDVDPIWQKVGVDAAVLSLGDQVHEIDDVEYGSSQWDEDVGWRSTAYPAVAAQKSEDEGIVDYKTVGLSGTWHPQGGRGQSTRFLDLGVEDTPNAWHGISGAPVFVGGRLIGIVDSAPLDFANQRLTGVPIEHIVQAAGFLSSTTPTHLAPPATTNWYLIALAEETSSTSRELIESALENMEAELQSLPAEYVGEVVVPKLLVDLCEELRTPGRWLQLVELVASAPVMIIDVTRFEPAAMMVLGIRAVARRGVTVAVTRNPLTEAHLKDLPFNIQETRLVSIARGQPARDNLINAIRAGALEMRSRPDYLDLPAYDSVRGRPPPPQQPGTTSQMLVLCPFAEEYERHWQYIRMLISTKKARHEAVRMLEIESPRLVGQALYEQIRWNRHCMADWTWWRPNVFFEFGVRLACSRDDPVLIIQGTGPDQLRNGETLKLKQLARLRRLFEPAEYFLPVDDISATSEEQDDASANEEIDLIFTQHRDWLRGEEVKLRLGAVPTGATHEIVASAYAWNQEQINRPPHAVLINTIEARLGSDSQKNATEVLTLFSSNEDFSRALENRVREDWLAAWLYASTRMRDDAAQAAGPERDELIRLGERVVQALNFSNDPVHVQVSSDIMDLIDGWEPGS